MIDNQKIHDTLYKYCHEFLQVHEITHAANEIIKNPTVTDENKLLIAAVNTLTNTTKTAIQNEVLRYKVDNTNGTILKLIEKIDD